MSGILLASAVLAKAMELSVSDSTPSGSDSDFAACGSVSSGSAVVTVDGGVAPFTYAWTQEGTSAQRGPYTCNAPSSAGTTWSSNPTVCDGDSPSSETWRCTVTDNNGQEATIDVTVDLNWINLN